MIIYKKALMLFEYRDELYDYCFYSFLKFHTKNLGKYTARIQPEGLKIFVSIK